MLLAALFLSGASIAASGECCPEPRCSVEPGVVRATGADPGRRLRADFMPPDAVVLVDSPTWPMATAALLAALESRVPTILLEQDPDQAATAYAVRPAPNADGAIIDLRLDSGWVRDYGPLQVVTPDGLEWLDAGYYPERSADDELPRRLATAVAASVDSLPLALEGGALISNGAGLCASTTTSAGRAQVDLDDPPYVDALLDALGCRAWAIVPALEHDETGHIDMVAQFISADRALVAALDPLRFPAEARRLDDTAAILMRAARSLGRKLDIRRVRTPVDSRGRYLTYVNGTRLSGAFLVPRYTDVAPEEQRRAYRAIKAALGSDALIPILADELIAMGGAVHCATLGITLPKQGTR